MSQIKMTEAEATEWVYDQDETGEVDQDQLEAAFAALHGRPADDDDRQNGLWSLCCNMTPNCGTRPEPTYDYRDIANSSWVSDLYRARPESGFPDIDPTKMSADDVQTLADYLRSDDSSLSEEDMDFSRDVADQIEALAK